MHHTKPYVYKPYPKWVELPDGNRMIVPNHKQHSALTGIEYDENGNEVVKRAIPPTLETVIAAGYGDLAAPAVVAREQAKADQGIEPYGDVPVDQFVDPLDVKYAGEAAELLRQHAKDAQGADAPPALEPEDSPEYVEGAQAMMAAQSEETQPDPDLAADLAGIFATPEPEAVPEKKRRGKAAKE